MWYSLCFRRHPAPFHSLHQINPKQHQTHCGCLFCRIPHHLQFRHDPISPRFVLLICDGCSLLCFILQRAFSLSLSHSLPLSLPLAFVAEMCYQPLTSPVNLQNCAPEDLKKIPDQALMCPFQKKMEKNRRKENVTKMWNPSKCIHVSCRWKSNPRCQGSVFIAYIRPMYVYIHTLSYKHT